MILARNPATRRRSDRPRRNGAAAVELALALPLLCFVMVVAIDYGRMVPAAMTVADCARHGALHAASPELAAASPFADAAQAALAGASGLQPAPVVTRTDGQDAAGRPFVEVTVAYSFRPLIRYPGLPEAVPLRRTVRMPSLPN